MVRVLPLLFALHSFSHYGSRAVAFDPPPTHSPPSMTDAATTVKINLAAFASYAAQSARRDVLLFFLIVAQSVSDPVVRKLRSAAGAHAAYGCLLLCCSQ